MNPVDRTYTIKQSDLDRLQQIANENREENKKLEASVQRLHMAIDKTMVIASDAVRKSKEARAARMDTLEGMEAQNPAPQPKAEKESAFDRALISAATWLKDFWQNLLQMLGII